MNINKISQYILKNYDENVENFIRLLDEINCDLIYNGRGIEDAIYNKRVYACSIRLRVKRNKILDTIFPIMFGSKLDMAIRKFHITEFQSLDRIPNILELWDGEGEKEFEKADIAITCFLINGILKQIPFYITNDSSNVHIVKNSIARLYRYNSEEKGKQLSMYFDNIEGFDRNDLVLKLNNGASFKFKKESEVFKEINEFFQCPYNVKPRIVFKEIFAKGFKIDNIENKIVISPGHIFYKLFKKTLYVPLKNEDFALIRKKHLIVTKSIENGDLLHILSKKTIFHKEMNFKNKMVNNNAKTEIPREISQYDQIVMDRKSTCYRDINCQYYPYFPYLSHLCIIKLSKKVKTNSALSYNNSFFGFLGLFGTSETKNVGRTMILAKDTFISTRENVSELYRVLSLEEGSDGFYVVINAACIEVTRKTFESVDLLKLKRHFEFIECYQSNTFIHINYKIGLLFKKLEEGLWVTSREIHFWMHKLYGFTTIEELIQFKGYDFIISHSADIIKYYKHNNFNKNILTLNHLKNSILSHTPDYSTYFLETVSAYSDLTEKHVPLLKPENKLSEFYTMYVPKINLMYSSFLGSTQEDCIVVNSKIKAFDCYRLYTVKLKFAHESTKYFHVALGPQNPAERNSFLGTIVCPTNAISIKSHTMHLLTKTLSANIVEIYFTKPNFSVLKWHMSGKFFFVCIYSFHKLSSGDKLCSFNGQKGVVALFNRLPRSRFIAPDLIINPYCLISRQTMGQVQESRDLGGKDYDSLLNSDGRPIGGSAFIGPVHYFAVNYWSSEQIHLADRCIKEKITGQYLKGRQFGTSKISTMELVALAGQGLANILEEKLFEHGDRIIHEDIALPKSVKLCEEDAKSFKCNITYNSTPSIETYTPLQHLNDSLNPAPKRRRNI